MLWRKEKLKKKKKTTKKNLVMTGNIYEHPLFTQALYVVTGLNGFYFDQQKLQYHKHLHKCQKLNLNFAENS